ncbi:dehydrogenase cytochrome b560 subunit, mitochondrial [Seminavis robusta]|uniref:Dehydrogenase cytochrome b560 subunit, mitochondrial n=1 Tax=Seminavis robusta TaxID=568900 RepID=A0A9N8HET9_9STRA|nr:dehydrogenase cytochrome b560 subunit, mitochondrial [Seminavis robusta]|eukprot:Sro426_g140350.1 dehydrogenase cytochrome b560 subunit, mitochondrial (146) ;mRNA; f:16583-17108
MTVLSKQSAEEYKKQNYTTRQKELGRPVSPHVTIYSFPVGALSSITNRVTGCVLTFGAAGLGAAELVGGAGTSLWIMQTIGSQGFLVASAAKFSVAFPVIYHCGGAVRHLIWDYYPEYLENTDVEKSSTALFGISTLISLGFVVV